MNDRESAVPDWFLFACTACGWQGEGDSPRNVQWAHDSAVSRTSGPHHEPTWVVTVVPDVTCHDHWHCDPERAAHSCDTSNRHRACPTCGAEPGVFVFATPRRTAPDLLRVLWRVTLSDARKLCADPRTSSRSHRLCWAYDPGRRDRDWAWVTDNRAYSDVLADLRVTVLSRQVQVPTL